MANVPVDPSEASTPSLSEISEIARAIPWGGVLFVAGVFGLIFTLWIDTMPGWFELFGMPFMVLMLALTCARVILFRRGTFRDWSGWMVLLGCMVVTAVLAPAGEVPSAKANILGALFLIFSVIATVLAWVSSGKQHRT